jgi:hypothetical protein
MEFEDLFTKSRWSILKELAKADKSAADIAKKTSQSTANATQQLAILEAYGMVRKAKQGQEKQKPGKPGKPKTPYALNQEIFCFSFLKHGMAEKSVIKLRETDFFPKFILNAYFTMKEEDHYPIIKFVCESEILKKADSIAFLQSNEKEIELFIITEQNLNDFRENYSNFHVNGLDGKTKKIISWSHNKKELEEGLEKKEDYFTNLVKNSKELIDKKEYLKELKENI